MRLYSMNKAKAQRQIGEHLAAERKQLAKDSAKRSATYFELKADNQGGELIKQYNRNYKRKRAQLHAI